MPTILLIFKQNITQMWNLVHNCNNIKLHKVWKMCTS